MSGTPQMRNRSARAGRHRQARTAGERSAEHFGGTAADLFACEGEEHAYGGDAGTRAPSLSHTCGHTGRAGTDDDDCCLLVLIQ